MIRLILYSAVIAIVAGCASGAPDASDTDLSWLGALVGGLVGFGLFFLVLFLSRPKD